MKLIVRITFFLLFVGSIVCSAQTKEIKGADRLTATYLGETRPLREITSAYNLSAERRAEKKANKPSFEPRNFLGWDGPVRVNPNAKPVGDDPLIQRASARNSLTVMPKFVVEGIDEPEAQGVVVPDVNGEIGRNEFVQVVNASWLQIFGRDGSELTQPFSANVIWNEIGLTSFSDPVVQYDEQVDRWLVTDLANLSTILYAVSTSGDPLGTYHAYSFMAPTACDYPKYGITPTSYFTTVNPIFGEEPIYIFNRQQMLEGAATIDVQQVDFPSIDGKFPTGTPADWNGKLLPFDNNLHMLRVKDDAWANGNTEDILEIWSVDVDWNDADETTATLTELTPSAFDADVCGNGGQTCIPQGGTNTQLDAIATIIMNKVIQRNFTTHESIVLNFTVKATNDGVSGIRWMELRRSDGGPWSIYQEGTYAPDDDLYRWLGAICINERGDIGLAYATSSSEALPALRMTGRTALAPLGEMNVAEVELKSGEGPRSLANRYGDYFAMTSDPIGNDFWFTGEYVRADGSWSTIVTSFAFNRDTFDLGLESITSPADGPMLSDQETVSVAVRNNGLMPQSNFTVSYRLDNGMDIVEAANIDTLKPDSIYHHTFASTVDLSQIGVYSFQASVEAVRDDLPSNNVLSRVISHQPNRDMAALAVDNLPEFTCDTALNLNVVFQNVGVDTVTMLQYDVFLNGEGPTAQSWTGSLTAGERLIETIGLTDLQFGVQSLVIIVRELNGADDQVNTNDSLFLNFDVINGHSVSLNIVTDDYPEETSWELYKNDNIIAAGNPSLASDTNRVTLCLELDSCYTFVLKDSYGDGIFEPGTYFILNEDGEVLASMLENDFGSEERNYFCVGPCTIYGSAGVTDASSATASDGAIALMAESGLPPFSYSIDSGQVYQAFPIFNDLMPGLYHVAIRGRGDCLYRDTIRVGFNSSTANLQGAEARINVYPNPNEYGFYTVDIQGLTSSNNSIKYKVLSQDGKTIHHGQLPKVNEHYSGILSLYKYPAGVYYLYVLDEGIEKMIKVIKSNGS